MGQASFSQVYSTSQRSSRSSLLILPNPPHPQGKAPKVLKPRKKEGPQRLPCRQDAAGSCVLGGDHLFCPKPPRDHRSKQTGSGSRMGERRR